MLINKISVINNINKNKLNKNYNDKSLAFQGSVNGKFYKNTIILESKKALNNPNWKDQLLASKKTLKDSFTTWHKRNGHNDIIGRIFIGVLTLGLSEIVWGGIQAIWDKDENKLIDKKIETIEDCLNNLREENDRKLL